MSKQSTHINEAAFAAIFEKAWAAGVAAATTKTPTPMHVQMATGLTDKFDFSKPFETVFEGACGFAWVNVYGASPAGRKDIPFVKWLRYMAAKTGDRRYGRFAGYERCWQIWISDYNQSVERKEAHAGAMAAVLQEAGIKAYGGSRLD